MKRIIGIKKLTACALAMTVAGSILLCSCDKAETTTSSEEQTTTTSETTTETTEPTPYNAKDHTTYEKIQLDGEAEHLFKAFDYSYIESDKYVLLLEKDVRLPGDFVNNLDAIINEIEKQMGLSYVPEGYNVTAVPDMSWHYNNTNPWAQWDIGTKIPIFVCADYDDSYVGSIGNVEYVRITQYDLFSDELWNSVYKDKPNRDKLGFVDYVEITEDIAKHIAFRYNFNDIPGILPAGIGNYMSYTVLDALSDKYPNIKLANERKYRYDPSIPEVVNAKNAEEVFMRDYTYDEYDYEGTTYEDVTLYDAQALYGRYFCQFLKETYGPDYYKKTSEMMTKYGDGKYYATIMKTAFSDEELFTKFGDWCVKNKALQKKEGVFPM